MCWWTTKQHETKQRVYEDLYDKLDIKEREVDLEQGRDTKVRQEWKCVDRLHKWDGKLEGDYKS